MASIIRFATLATLASATDYTTNMTGTLFLPAWVCIMLMKTERYALTSGATVVEIFIAIFGACVVTLGPVYKRLRYGDPRGSSSKLKRPGTGVEGWEKGIRRIERISIHTRGSFERLGDHDAGSEASIVNGGHHITVPMRAIRVERGLD